MQIRVRILDPHFEKVDPDLTTIDLDKIEEIKTSPTEEAII